MIRTAFRTLLMLLVGILALVLASGLVLRAGGGTWAANRVLASLDPLPGIMFRVGGAKGNTFSWLELRDVRLAHREGSVPLSVARVRIRYDLGSLMAGRVNLREVVVSHPRVVLQQLPDGSWDLPQLGKGKADSPKSTPPKIAIHSFSVAEGKVLVRLGTSEPDSIAATFEAEGSLAGAALRLTRFEVRSPRSLVSGSGALPLSSPGELEVDLSARPFALRDLRFLGSRFDRPDEIAATIRVTGTTDRAAFRVEAPIIEGRHLRAQGVVTHPKAAPLEYKVEGDFGGLDPSLFISARGLPQLVNGRVRVDLAGPSMDRLSGDVNASVYEPTRERQGQRRIVAEARFHEGRAGVRLQADVGLAAIGLRGWITPFQAIPSYDLSAQVRRLPSASPAWLTRLLGRAGRDFRVALVGEGFSAEKRDLRARVTLNPDPAAAGLLDAGFAEMRLRGGSGDFRTKARSDSGTVTLSGAAKLGPELELQIHRGVIKGLNVAAVVGDSGVSSLDAEFTIKSRGTSARRASAHVTLDQVKLVYGPRTFSQGRLQLDLDSGAVDVRGTGRINGDSVVVSAVAHPFLAVPSLSLRDFSFSRLELAGLLPEARIEGEFSGTARGRVEGRNLDQLKLQATVSLARSRIGDHEITRAMVGGTLDRGQLALNVKADAPAGRIELTGVGRPFDSTPSFTLEQGEFRELDLGAIFTSAGWHTSLAGSFSAEGSGKTTEGAAGKARLTLRSSTVNDARLTGGQVEARLAGGRLELSGVLKAQDDSLTIRTAAYPFETPIRLNLAGTASVAALAPFLGRSVPEAGGEAAIRVEGEWGSLETMNLKGEMRLAGHANDVRLDSVRTSFQLRGGILTVDTIALRSSVASVGGSGLLDLTRGARVPSDLQIAGWLGDISSLATLLGVSRLGIDSGNFIASARGTREDLAIKLEARGDNLEVGTRRIGGFRASASGNVAADRSIKGGTADLLLERLPVGKTTVRTVRLQGTKRETGLLLRAEAVVDPERSFLVVSNLTPDSARIQLDTLEIKLPGDHWNLVRPVTIGYAGPIRVNDFSLATRGRSIKVDGVVDRRGEQRLHATVRALRLGRFTDLFSAGQLDGEVNGTFDLSGPAAAPHARGDVAFDMRARGKEVGTTRARMDWSPAGLLLDIGVLQKEGDSLRVKGRIPLVLSLAEDDTAGMIRPVPGGQLLVDAVTRRFRLDDVGELFDPETVRKLRGQLVMDAHAAGTLQTPRLSGEIALSDASVRVPRLGATYEKGQLRLSLQGQEIRVTQARLESGGGHLETQGTIQLTSFPQAAMDLDSRLSNFRVAAAPEFRSSVSGNLSLTGAGKAPVLKGSLEVSNTDVYLQAKNLEQSAEAVELSPEDLRILERRFGQGVTRGAERTAKPLAAWDITLGLKLADNVWLRRHSDPVMAVELAGKVDVRKEPAGDLQVFGEIRPEAGRSFVQVVGRRFDVREGSVKLNGPLNQTALALKAEYVAPSPSGAPPVLITTAVRSDTGKITVTLSSIPVLRSEDIMSYLTTGRPASTDPTLESDEQDALSTTTSLAVGAALGTVAGGAGQRLGLDVIQILQDREGGQTLVAGKYVSAPLYLGFRQPIVTSTTAGSSDTKSDLVEFEVEYAALRKLLLNFQGGGSEFRAFLRLRR